MAYAGTPIQCGKPGLWSLSGAHAEAAQVAEGRNRFHAGHRPAACASSLAGGDVPSVAARSVAARFVAPTSACFPCASAAGCGPGFCSF